MNHKTFFWFFLPTALAMFLFIALPLTSIVSQSLHTPHDAVLVVVESCDPFGCKSETTIDHEATQQLKEDQRPKASGLDLKFILIEIIWPLKRSVSFGRIRQTLLILCQVLIIFHFIRQWDSR
jgi:hypothetical protein